ncbi:MAG TPA: hypothetical protein VGD60_01720 [Candidatus Acidoferrales bacterium]
MKFARMACLLGIMAAGPVAWCRSVSSSPLSPALQQVQVSVPAQASVPRLVQFSGTLKDSAARPLAGVASVTFAIYAEQDGGTALWSETQNVLADANGHYAVLLGAATSSGVPAELFSIGVGTGQSRWLGVTVARHEEMPRILLASVPYALKAADAETLGGLPASAYVTTQSLAAKSSTTILAPGSTTVLANAQTNAAAPAALPISNAGTPVTGAGVTDYIPLWSSSTTQGNSILFQTGGLIGIGTTTPAETLDVNGNSIFRGSFQLPPGHPAIASSGYESHSFQFQASSFNSGTGTSDTEAFGFRAEPLNNNTTNPSAKLDLFFGAGGSAPFTDTGFSFSSTGLVTFAPGQTFSGVSETLTGSLGLPNTSSSSQGVLTVGGTPFINDYQSSSNTFVGTNAGGAFASVVPGEFTFYSNTALGNDALFAVTGGAFNTATGASALKTNTGGSENTASGVEALVATTSGSTNSSLGVLSGATNTTGSSNTFLGTSADAATGNLSNSTALGANSQVSANNAIVLGSINGVNGATSNVDVAIGTTAPRSKLDVVSSFAGSATNPGPIVTVETTAAGGAVALDFNTYTPATTGTYTPAARIVANDDNFADDIIFYAKKQGAATNGLMQTMEIDPKGNVTAAGSITATGGLVGSGINIKNLAVTGMALIAGQTQIGGPFLVDTGAEFAANVQVDGNLAVTGNLTKGGGSFKIDDPIAPAEKYLSHSFVESPDMMNIYNGSVVLNARGEAVVQLPEWFDALNRDFQYQLTAIGAPGPKLYIAEKVHDNHFKIAGGKKGQEISWMVTGIRHDAWANAHRIPTEEEKPAKEQGTYLHPELFGAPPEMSAAAVRQ